MQLTDLTPAQKLTDDQKDVVTAMQDGAELIVHRSTGGATLMVEGKSAKAIPFDVWRPIYELDLMRRGPIVKGTARLYNLTEHGETEDLEPEKPDGVPED